MKFLPAAVILSCAAMLAGCGRQSASPSEADQQAQERLLEQQQAEQQRALHEREAALDERERLLAQREQQSATPVPTEQTAPAEQIAQTAPPQAPVPAPQPAAPSAEASYQAFYDSLSPYGSWVQMAGYGYVWQPFSTIRDAGWRPYTLGHWAYTDDGWTWVSNEPFGWITYHYGRWMRTHSIGWVWIPGDQWAPAWVSWRYGNDFAGWAPLPPEAQFNPSAGIQGWADDQYNLGPADYTFVPTAAFGEDSMAENEVPPDQVEPIYDDSNNVTNIYYDTGAYAIFCYGPNYNFLRSKSRRPLPPPFTLKRGGFLAGGKNGAVISGNTLQVTAPRIVRPSRPAAPKTIRVSITDTRVIAPSHPPPAPGVEPPPLYKPPQGGNPRTTDGAPNPGRESDGHPEAEAPKPEEPPGPPKSRPPQGSQQPEQPPEGQQQQAADQIERQRQEAEAARAAVQEQRAEAAARAQEAAAQQQALKAAQAQQQAARVQALQEQQAARVQAARAAQAASLPAGSPGR